MTDHLSSTLMILSCQNPKYTVRSIAVKSFGCGTNLFRAYKKTIHRRVFCQSDEVSVVIAHFICLLGIAKKEL